MNQRQALSKASEYAGSIIRSSATSYIRYAPYYCNKPQGASTQVQHSNYPRAAVARAADVAEIALHLLDRWSGEGRQSIQRDADDYSVSHTARAMLARALKVQA